MEAAGQPHLYSCSHNRYSTTPKSNMSLCTAYNLPANTTALSNQKRYAWMRIGRWSSSRKSGHALKPMWTIQVGEEDESVGAGGHMQAEQQQEAALDSAVSEVVESLVAWVEDDVQQQSRDPYMSAHPSSPLAPSAPSHPPSPPPPPPTPPPPPSHEEEESPSERAKQEDLPYWMKGGQQEESGSPRSVLSHEIPAGRLSQVCSSAPPACHPPTLPSSPFTRGTHFVSSDVM